MMGRVGRNRKSDPVPRREDRRGRRRCRADGGRFLRRLRRNRGLGFLYRFPFERTKKNIIEKEKEKYREKEREKVVIVVCTRWSGLWC